MWLSSHRELAKAIAIGVASLSLLLLGAWPIYQNSSTVLNQIARKTVELDTLNERITILNRLDVNVLSERVEVIDRALPPSKDVLLYLTAIDGLSRELGLTFGGLSLAPGAISEATESGKASTPSTTKSKTGLLQSLATEIKMTGGEESIYAFLRTIEEVLPLMQIKDIKVSVLAGEQFNLTLTLAMLWAEPSTIEVKSKITLFNETEDKYFQQLATYKRFEPVANFAQIQTPKGDLFAPFSQSQDQSVIPQQ